jgi:hypothetical protein
MVMSEVALLRFNVTRRLVELLWGNTSGLFVLGDEKKDMCAIAWRRNAGGAIVVISIVNIDEKSLIKIKRT